MGAKKVKDVTSEVSSPAHSRIGASSMHRWAACPGSVQLSVGIPNRSSKYAEEGTEAHELAAFRLVEGCYDRHPSASDSEMLEAVEVYVEYVEALQKKAQVGDPKKGATACCWVEHKFDLSSIHPGLFGTADCVIYDENEKTLHVIDYKHGAGMAVEVEENEQLMYYGVGALTTLNLAGVEKVVLTIVQPRCPHKGGTIRSWETTPARLLDFTLDLVQFAKETEKPNAALSPGDHCRFCPAQVICPAIRSRVDKSAQEVFASVKRIDTTALAPTTANGLSDPERLGKLLHWLPVLEGWISGIRAFANSEAEHGRQIPGWKLVARQGRRKWTDETAIAQFLENEFPQVVRDFYHRELKSVSQIEKILHKKQHPKLIPFFASVSSGNTMVVESDPREPIVTMDAAQAFQQVQLDSPMAVDPFS